MGLGHVPQDPLRAQGEGVDVQGRQRRRAAVTRDLGARDLGQGDRGTRDLSRRARGQWGEDLAARWYANAGYEIVARNWRVRAGEIDLILARPRLVVFAEVKARATDAFGVPSAAVTVAKQLRLRRLGAQWLAEAGVHGVDVRFDVVSVLGVRVEVIEGAF